MFDQVRFLLSGAQQVNHTRAYMTMRQLIFDLNLGVHATSLYLLMESLGAADTVIERSAVEDLWNAGSGELERALLDLTDRGIIVMELGRMRIQPAQAWK